MFITKSSIMNRWFSDLFEWLFECENIFGFKGLEGYGYDEIICVFG